MSTQPVLLLSEMEPTASADEAAAAENAAVYASLAATENVVATEDPSGNPVGAGWGVDFEDARRGASDASSAAAHTASAEDAAVSGNGGGDFIDFAHGTTSASAQNIVDNGLNRDAALAAMVGSTEPGSFFTVQVDPLNTNEALELAASWATRHNPQDICIVIGRLPRSVVESLESSRLLVHRFQPPESIFRPDSYDIVNREATFFSFKVR